MLQGWAPASRLDQIEARLRDSLSLPFVIDSHAPRADERPSPVTQAARTETVRTDQTNLSRSDIAGGFVLINRLPPDPRHRR